MTSTPLSRSRVARITLPATWAARRSVPALAIAVLAVAGLVLFSLFVGVADLDAHLLRTSRLPRTLALVLAGSALAVSGLVMQLLTRNIFVEPSTAGTLEFASAGLLACALLIPDAPVIVRMLVGALAALAGTGIFLKLLSHIPMREVLMVPLVGIMLGGVVSAATTFVAYRADLVQSLGAWTTGDFSAVLSGRYELLWAAGALTVVVAVLADRFTVAGMGEAFTTNLGLNHRRTMALGLGVVAVTSAVVVVTVGGLPFLGLVVPNIVRRIVGDNARIAVPWVAVLGAGFVLACDLVSRLVIHPFEMPIGTVMGVLGAGIFLVMLLKGRR